MYSINIPNIPNNEINEKSLNQFKNGLRHIRKIRVKKGKRKDLAQTKQRQNIVKDIMQNKIKQKE